MRDWRLWFIAFGSEGILLAIVFYFDRTNVSFGAGIALALTQLPGSYLSELMVSNTGPQWLYDPLMFSIQTLLFGATLHLAKFVKGKIKDASNTRPESPK